LLKLLYFTVEFFVVIGYHNIRSYLEKARSGGVLAHAYCLIGPQGVGKRAIARDVAASLLGTTEEHLAQQPNFYEIARREDEKTGKLKKEIGVKDARELKERLSMGRWGGDYQVAIIDEAEFLNEEASNALLKLLEEPPQGSVLFLLTTDDHALLPTIRSRVQCLFMEPLSDEALAAGLVEAGFAKNDIDRVVPLSFGRPGTARTLLTDAEALAVCETERKRLSKIIGQPMYVKIQAVEDLFGESEDHVRGREKLVTALEVWLASFKQELESLAVRGESTFANAFTVGRIRTIIDSILSTRVLLRKNIHPRLLLENLLMHF